MRRDQVDETSEWQRGCSYLRFTRDETWPISMVSGLDAIPEDEKVVRIFAAVASKNDVVRFFAATTSKCVEGNQFDVNTWQSRINYIK